MSDDPKDEKKSDRMGGTGSSLMRDRIADL